MVRALAQKVTRFVRASTETVPIAISTFLEPKGDPRLRTVSGDSVPVERPMNSIGCHRGRCAKGRESITRRTSSSSRYPVEGLTGVLERLAERMESVDRVDDVVDDEAELHRQPRFDNHIGGTPPDHVDADDLVSFPVLDEPDEHIRVLDGFSTRDVRHLDSPARTGPVHVLQPGRSDGGELWAREDDCWDRVTDVRSEFVQQASGWSARRLSTVELFDLNMDFWNGREHDHAEADRVVREQPIIGRSRREEDHDA